MEKKIWPKYKVFYSWSKWQKTTTFGTSQTSVVDVGCVKFIGRTYVVCLHTLHSSVLFGYCRLKQKRKCFSCNSHPGQNSHFCHLCISSFQKKIKISFRPEPWSIKTKAKTFTENWDSKRHLLEFPWPVSRLRTIFLIRNKTFLFFKIERWNFQVHFEIEFHETLQNFSSIR